MSSQQTKNKDKKIVFSVLLFIFLVCNASGTRKTLANLLASLPFTVPLFAHKNSHSPDKKQKTVLSIICGLAGTSLSVLIFRQTSIKVFLSAFAGFSVFLLNEFAFIKFKKNRHKTAFSLSFLALFMICYL